MEATASAEDFPRAPGSFWERVKGGSKKAGKAAKSVVMYVGAVPRRAYRRMTGTKAEPRGARSGVRWVGRSIRKTVAYLGMGLASILQIGVGVVVALILAVAFAAFVLVTTVLGLISGIAAGIYNLSRKTVVFFSWVASDEKVTFRDYARSEEARQHDVWASLTDKISAAMEEDEGDIVVTSEFQNDRELWGTQREMFDKNAQSLKEKAALQVQADMDAAGSAFPGALSAQVSSADPYAEPKTWLSPLNKTLEQMAQWLEHNPDKAAVDFKFRNVPPEELLEAITQLRNTAKGREERSYWEGRLRALKEIHRRPTELEEHGRAWALIYMEMKSQQREWTLKYVRAGFIDMVNDLKASKKKQRGGHIASV